jgi:DNA-binding IclR family transcriptional regulator
MRNAVTNATPNEPRDPLGSVDNVLRLLLLFRGGRPVRVTDASRELAVSRSTAHRLLATLAFRGFVRQDRTTRAYLVGDALVDLGRSVSREAELEAIAHPEMEMLARKLRETIHLGVLQGTSAAYVACVESVETLRTGSHVGTSFPAHATACGKALLAELSARELRARYTGESFATGRKNAIRSWDGLLAALDAVRANGYATNVEETEPGVNALAVAIKDGEGRVYGALTITGPSSRFRRRKMEPYARELARAAERILAHLEPGQRPA